MFIFMSEDGLQIAEDCIKKALAAGADDADAIVCESDDINVRVRMGKSETVERSESKDLGLRILIKDGDGFKQTIVSSNDFSPEVIPEVVEKAIEMAKAVPADEYVDLATPEQACKEFKDLDLLDKTSADAAELLKMAEICESSALDVSGVTNSEGAEADFGTNTISVANSRGFGHSYMTTRCGVSASVIAGEGTNMETDYDYAISRHLGDLIDPAKVGKSAGERALSKLNPKKIKTCKVPVVFDSRVASGLVSSLAGAINGSSVSKGTSFLADKLGEKIFDDKINIVDDPHMIRGISSKPFDGEGICGEKLKVIENGKLASWILDLRSAKKLGMQSTGHASRSTSSTPSPSTTNFYMEAGGLSLEELMADVKEGLYITDAFGMGVNTVTGDYSQGAYGFWIENGKKAYPVSEITIAGHMLEMFSQITAANDLEFKYSTNAPTVRIDNMTVAGV